MNHPHSLLGLPALALALLWLLCTPSSAFWIISHKSLVSQRLDPILTSGISGHTHAFVGQSSVEPLAAYETLRAASEQGRCTTSGVGADALSYWAPQLYHYSPDNVSRVSVCLLIVILLLTIFTFYLSAHFC